MFKFEPLEGTVRLIRLVGPVVDARCGRKTRPVSSSTQQAQERWKVKKKQSPQQCILLFGLVRTRWLSNICDWNFMSFKWCMVLFSYSMVFHWIWEQKTDSSSFFIECWLIYCSTTDVCEVATKRCFFCLFFLRMFWGRVICWTVLKHFFRLLHSRSRRPPCEGWEGNSRSQRNAPLWGTLKFNVENDGLVCPLWLLSGLRCCGLDCRIGTCVPRRHTE